jgi:hypothetical protein
LTITTSIARIGVFPDIQNRKLANKSKWEFRPFAACWSEFLNGRLMPEIARLTVMFRRGWSEKQFAEQGAQRVRRRLQRLGDNYTLF